MRALRRGEQERERERAYDARKGTVVDCFEVPPLNLERAAVVHDRRLKVSLLPVAEAAVVVEVGVVREEINRAGEVLYGPVELQRSIEGYAAVVVRVRITRFDLERAGVVSDRGVEAL